MSQEGGGFPQGQLWIKVGEPVQFARIRCGQYGRHQLTFYPAGSCPPNTNLRGGIRHDLFVLFLPRKLGYLARFGQRIYEPNSGADLRAIEENYVSAVLARKLHRLVKLSSVSEAP